MNKSDFSEFPDTYKEGVFTIQLNSWEEFNSVVKKFEKYTKYYWRGQKNDDLLLSSFDRYNKERRINLKKEERKKRLEEILENFKKRLSDVKNIDSFSKETIWAIGQHYGLKTPLLDWTVNPYIAAYFAFFENQGKDNRFIYVLNISIKLLTDGHERFIDFPIPNDKFDKAQNKRLERQEGRLSYASESRDIENVLKLFWRTARKKDKYVDGDIFLLKVLIPEEFRRECLESLRKMRIYHGFLFPDYAGAVEISKIELGIKDCCHPRGGEPRAGLNVLNFLG